MLHSSPAGRLPPAGGLTAKIVIVGDSCVGKTAIFHRIIDDSFPGNLLATVQPSLQAFTFCVDGRDIILHIWDTAGHERFRAMTKSFFRGAAGALLVYDITRLETFKALAAWLGDLHKLCVPNAYVLLIGNKIDLADERQVGQQEVEEFCAANQLVGLETSALDGSGVQEAFTRLATEVYHLVQKKAVPINRSAGPIERPDQSAQKDCC
jgi:small GTP-binding protein